MSEAATEAEVVEPEPETTDEPETDEPEEDETLEEPEIEAEPEPESDPTPEPQGHSEEWWEKAWEASEKEDSAHAAKVGKIFEEEAQAFMVCPMCATGPAGFLTSTQLVPEQEQVIRQILGMTSPDEYEAMDGASICPKCKGWGKVRTPSLVPEEAVQPCMNCNEKGWTYVPGPGAAVNPGVFGMPPAAPPTTGNGTDTQPDAEIQYPDVWGRPVGHPHYGIAPADVTG